MTLPFALIVASIRIEACAHILSGVIYGLLKLANGVFVKRLLILLLFSPSPLFAQSPFDGTWIINSDTAQLPEKSQVYALAEGVFRCSSCVPKIEIAADGQDQKVAGSSYFDTESVRVVDAHTVEFVAKKEGKTMFTELDTISPDGTTLTQTVTDTTESQAVTIETLSRRVAKGAPGTHALSGSWLAYKIHRSKNGATIKYRCTKEGFSAETPLGERFDAKFDDKDYPVEDDPGHTMVSVKRLNASSVELTSKRNGKIVGVLHLSVAPSGETIHVVFDDKESDTTATYEMQKQP